jgi:hypothetical protein
VIGNRTNNLHVQKAAAIILNMQLCTTHSGCPLFLVFADAENLILKEKKTLMCYRPLCRVLKFTGGGVEWLVNLDTAMKFPVP